VPIVIGSLSPLIVHYQC